MKRFCDNRLPFDEKTKASPVRLMCSPHRSPERRALDISLNREFVKAPIDALGFAIASWTRWRRRHLKTHLFCTTRLQQQSFFCRTKRTFAICRRPACPFYRSIRNS